MDQGKNELESSLVARAGLILADSIKRCSAYGELSQLSDDTRDWEKVLEIGSLLLEPTSYSRDSMAITIADLIGLGVQDAQISVSILGR